MKKSRINMYKDSIRFNYAALITSFSLVGVALILAYNFTLPKYLGELAGSIVSIAKMKTVEPRTTLAFKNYLKFNFLLPSFSY